MLIMLAILGLYGYSATFAFLPLDDTDIILNRLDYLRDFGNIVDIFSSPLYKDIVTSLYRPVLFLTFMLDSILGGGSPVSFHVSNILFHVVAVLLLWSLLFNFHVSDTTNFILTALFALHPIHVHAVAWISGRNDVLLAIVLLLIWITFFKWRLHQKNKYLISHFMLLFLAFFVKETAVIIPVTLVIFAVVVQPVGKQIKLLMSGWGFSTISALVIRSIVVTGNIPVKISELSITIKQFGFVFTNYLGKIFIPVDYSVIPSVMDMNILPGIIGLVVVIVSGIFINKRDSRIFWFGLLWYLLFISPTILWSIWSGIQEYYEHREYIPFVGLLISASQLEFETRLKISKPVRNLIFSGLLIILGLSSFQRLLKYRDPISFTDSAVLESPSHARSHSMRGSVQKELGNYAVALDEFGKALNIRPGIQWVYSDCGQIKLNLGEFEQAVQLFSMAIKLKPSDGNAYFNRAIAYTIQKDYTSAIQDYTEAIRLDPKNADYIYNRGLAYRSSGDEMSALGDFRQALILLPDSELLMKEISSLEMSTE